MHGSGNFRGKGQDQNDPDLRTRWMQNLAEIVKRQPAGLQAVLWPSRRIPIRATPHAAAKTAVIADLSCVAEDHEVVYGEILDFEIIPYRSFILLFPLPHWTGDRFFADFN